ncbi:hypothetical protein C6Y40_13215 [Alteromonas alba]|uniref:Uncharacterized protein n=2 Tax=Alteromonas alba TaxID=2079529 RepID=A0A2S9V9B9_9ALTE|nr:hypothetical protein [Alteromonadaceae bacterium]PRO73061.1 hypothetical protein C6Y40_13215 [Alteromonas alba]|tara:strand:- start:8522 stop:8857 length:336 start_codon:yes stop_codon:yes gene_type:complete
MAHDYTGNNAIWLVLTEEITMTHTEIILLVTAMLGLGLFCHYLDAKYQWQLSAWFYGKPVNPFKKTEQANSQTSAQKDAEIAALKERIAVLEKIVTEPAYELNLELNKLRN